MLAPSAYQLPGQRPSSVQFHLHLALVPGKQGQADSDKGIHSTKGHLQEKKRISVGYSTTHTNKLEPSLKQLRLNQPNM